LIRHAADNTSLTGPGEADYERVGEGFASGTGCAPGSADYDKLRATYLGFWEHLRQAADADGDGKVTRDELLKNVEEFFYGEDPNAPGNWLVGPL
jgi:hypothetical protein